MCGWELLTVAKYVRVNSNVILKVDSHEDLVNSGRNFVSKNILHRLYYKPIAKYASKHLEEILCVSISVIEFLRDFYELPKSKLKFYPLGGDIPDDKNYNLMRNKVRTFHTISENQILFSQTGKLTPRKKLIKTLKAFTQVKNDSFILIVAGVIDLPNQQEIIEIIESDPRIKYIGWQTSEQIDELLCATDIYLQPGTQSATMQNSLCKRCAVVLDDVPSHVPYIKGNGWHLNEENTLVDVFNAVDKAPHKIKGYSDASYQIAQELLDYDKLSKQLLIRE
jgi:glycosyltransferase involved in cell wall biosynthesis